MTNVSCYLDARADITQAMARSVEYERGRLPSEQVESLRTSFAYGLSTRTPEPRSEATSETSQPISLDSSQPASSKRKQRTTSLLRQIEPYNRSPEPESDDVSQNPRSSTTSLSQPRPKPKQKRKNANLLREIAHHNISPEPGLKAASETLQSNTRGSSQLLSRKRRRGSTMLRELDAHNESPEPEPEAGSGTLQPVNRGSSRPGLPKRRPKSMPRPQLTDLETSPDPSTDSEQENIRLKTARSSQQASGNPRPTSAMLREIAAHNESPEDSEPDMNLLRTSTKVPFLTRSARKDLEKVLKNEALTPRKSLNVKSLMKAELLGTPKGIKTFYFEGHNNPRSTSHQTQHKSPEDMEFNIGEDVDDGDFFPKKTKPSGRSRSQPFLARRTEPEQSKGPIESDERSEEVEAESAWSKWDSKKAGVDNLINTPRYGPRPSQQDMRVGARRFEGAFYVEQGLHIFTPMRDEFSDFERFLEDVEEVAGRETGVVKVIVPSNGLSPTPALEMNTVPRSLAMKITEINMSLKEATADGASKTYNMLMTSGTTSLKPDVLLHMIQSDKDKIIKKRRMGAEATTRDSVWKENHALSPYTEAKMIQRSEENGKAVFCALNEPATGDLRAALRCRSPKIKQLPGNRFWRSRSSEPGITEPVFHVATGAGPLSPLQMNRYAAYSLNYHHSGAPRMVTVIRPEHHTKLEEAMYQEQDAGNLFVSQPSEPPTCTQFLAHRQIYVPQGTLSSSHISHTEVVQNQGEMVITFPYAYHQAYTSGPNITEEMLYASERCAVFHREDLYQHCDFDCAAGQPDPFDIGPVFSATSSGAPLNAPPRSRHRDDEDDDDSEGAPHKRRRRRN